MGEVSLDVASKCSYPDSRRYGATPELVEALLDAGANVAHINDVRPRSPLTSRR